MKKNILLIPIILGISIIITFLVVSLFFNKHYLPNTYINGVNYGWYSVNNTEFRLINNAAPEAIELIKNDGLSEMVDLTQLEYEVLLNTDLENILQSQNSFMWIFALFKKDEFKADIKLTYNTENITSIVNNLKCVTSQKASPPQNAYIEKTDTGYQIVPETEGSLINKEVLETVLLYAINNGINTINLSEENCYQKAEITTNSEEIIRFSIMLDNINNLTITYDFSDRQEVLTPAEINQWITIDGTEILVDEAKAKQYITNLAYKYDTYLTDREFTTTAGNIITVGGGIYGWKTDISTSTEELINTIKNCESTTIKPVYTISGLCRDENDIGDTYVEISIEQQHMWYYKNGELLVDTDVVTGLANGKRDTPTGLFCIWSRETNRTLGTYEVQGYEAFVNYWMPIDWTGVGIHDATGRSNFGGNIYKTNGSHGCINTPYDAVKKIFENCVTGTPVVIY